jgi:hypothetical protein
MFCEAHMAEKPKQRAAWVRDLARGLIEKKLAT